MNDERKENEQLDNDVLREIGCIGAGNAATSLSDLIQQKVLITFPKIEVAHPKDVPKVLGLQDMQAVVVHKKLQGDYNCDIMLVFPEEEAEKIVSTMAKMTFGVEELDEEMKASAIEEVGNIVVGSFLSAISDFTNIKLVHTPPNHMIDIFDAILDRVSAKSCLSDKNAVIFHTCFKREEENIYGAVIIFFSEELQRELIRKGKAWLE